MKKSVTIKHRLQGWFIPYTKSEYANINLLIKTIQAFEEAYDVTSVNQISSYQLHYFLNSLYDT